ncbi:MAG: cytochrome c biogenesis protein CcdA [Methylocystis sp.]
MSLGVLGLALLAGILSILSPCVLPLLPLVLGAAAAKHRLGAPLLALGVALSFVVIGLFVATIGFAIGLDGSVFRLGSAVLMILFGIVLTAPPLQARFSAAVGPLSNMIDDAFRGFPASGSLGQLGLGLVLGAVWSPCVGPTLGAASVLAARGENMEQVALTMTAFGFGASLPLLLLGSLSRRYLSSKRDALLDGGKRVKQALGVLLIVVGASIVTGLDKDLEARLVEASPVWLTRLTTAL